MRILIISLSLLSSLLLSAQDEPRHCIGVRGGDMSGISYRHYRSEFEGTDLLLSFREDGAQLCFLHENYKPTLGELGKNFWFVSGYGAHAGFVNSHEFRFLFSRFEYPDPRISPLVGIDGYLALEYHFRELPLIFGLDYKPYFELSGYDFFSLQLWDTAIMIKYVFH
jgi:hypothetical protein